MVDEALRTFDVLSVRVTITGAGEGASAMEGSKATDTSIELLAEQAMVYFDG